MIITKTCAICATKFATICHQRLTCSKACRRERVRRRYRKWRLQHIEERRDYNRRWRLENIEHKHAYDRRWRINNRAMMREAAR